MIPSVIKDGNYFADGQGYAGRIKEMAQPKLEFVSEEIKAGGMVAAMESFFHLEKLESEVTLFEFSKDMLDKFGLQDNAAVKQRMVFAAERDDDSELLTQIEVVQHGRIKAIEPDGWELGKQVNTKLMMSLSYYRLAIGGEDIIEIDAVNYVFKVRGKDRFAERRAALGIN